MSADSDFAKQAQHVGMKAVVVKLGATVKNGRYLKLYNPRKGIVDCFSRQARGHGAETTAGLFCYADFELFFYKNTYQLNEFSTIHNFSKLAHSIEAMQAACLCSDLLVDLAVDAEQAEKLWSLYLHTLYELELTAQTYVSQASEAQERLHYVLAAYLLRALAVSGYHPDMEVFGRLEKQAVASAGGAATSSVPSNFSLALSSAAQASTGSRINRLSRASSNFTSASPANAAVATPDERRQLSFNFSFAEGRLELPAYSHKADFGYTQAEALQYILTADISKLFKVQVSARLALMLYNFAKKWLTYSLDHVYKSQETLEQLAADTESLTQLALELQRKKQAARENAESEH